MEMKFNNTMIVIIVEVMAIGKLGMSKEIYKSITRWL